MYMDIEQLTLLYNKYCASFSDACISLELSAHIIDMCNELHPKNILDLGSGWSSYVFRYACPNALITSVDDNVEWLKKTIEWCTMHDLNNGRFLLWDDIEKNGDCRFDLVLHDLGNRWKRAETLESVFSLADDGGTVIFDDIHKAEIKVPLSRMCALKKLQIIDLSAHTLDRHGRFAVRVDLPQRKL